MAVWTNYVIIILMFSQDLEHLIGFQWSLLNLPSFQHVYCFCIQQLTYSVTQNWNWGFTHNFRHIREVPLYSGYVNFSRLSQLQSNWCIFSNLNTLRKNLHPRSEPVKSMQNIQTSRTSSFFGWIVKMIIYRSKKKEIRYLKWVYQNLGVNITHCDIGKDQAWATKETSKLGVLE